MAGFAILLGAGLVLAVTLGAISVLWKTTHPPRRTYTDAVVRGWPGDPSEAEPPVAFADLRVPTSVGELSLWWMEGRACGGPAIVFLHGWGSGKLASLLRLGAFAPRARAIIAIDLPGHGESEGFSTIGVREPGAIVEVAEHLELGVDSLILAGSSLGSGIALVSAVELERQQGRACAGVLMEGPYRMPPVPVRNILRHQAKPWAVSSQLGLASLGVLVGMGPRFARFDRLEYAASLRGPLEIIHAGEDEVCPIEASRELAAAHPGGAVITDVPGAGHHELWSERFRSVSQAAVARSLDRMIGASAAGEAGGACDHALADGAR